MYGRSKFVENDRRGESLLRLIEDSEFVRGTEDSHVGRGPGSKKFDQTFLI